MLYKNKNKKLARKEIWKNAINTLTNKNYFTIITEKEIYLYWEHLKDLLEKNDILKLSELDNVLKSFIDYRHYSVQNSKIQNIKVLFFCGPEPENDITLLLNEGILEENIWLVEFEKRSYTSAIKIIKYSYPNVKIFKTKIENLFEVIKVKFDIVYLDYTASFFSKSQKTYKTTIELFKNNIIKDFGILITNYSEINPDDNDFDNNINIIKEYFYHLDLTDEYINFNFPKEDLENGLTNELIEKHYKNFYSMFLTHFHVYLSEIITPNLNIFNNTGIKQLIFNNNVDGKINRRIYYEYPNNETFWFEIFMEKISTNNNNLFQYLKNNKVKEALHYVNLLKDSSWIKELMNKEILELLENTQKNLLDSNYSFFCDVPQEHLWINLIINQLGAPYHVNLKSHIRFRYTGKKREMYTDLFILDKCRYFYDWLPSLNTLPETMLNIAKQLIIRINIDVIRKTNYHYLNSEGYMYGNLLCYNDVSFLKMLKIETRKELNSLEKDYNSFTEAFKTSNLLAQRIISNYSKSLNSLKKFDVRYNAHGWVYLKIEKVPEIFKIFGIKFKQHKIEELYNFRYVPQKKELYYNIIAPNTSYNYNIKLMIIETIQSIFERYGLKCKIIKILD